MSFGSLLVSVFTATRTDPCMPQISYENKVLTSNQTTLMQNITYKNVGVATHVTIFKSLH